MEIKIDKTQGIGLEKIARQVYDVVHAGGLALIPDRIGYGLVGNSPDSIQRIYELKGRSLTKPLTHYMNITCLSDIANISQIDIDLINRVTQEIPSCFVVPYKENNYFKNLNNYTLKQSTKEGTVALFFERDNPLIKGLLECSLTHDFPLIVTSANLSGSGNIYRFEEIPEAIRRGVDICISSEEPCKYLAEASEQIKKLGSTLVKLPERKILRKGVLSNLIAKFLKN